MVVQVDEQRLQDLIKLAQYKMLSRDTRCWRSPTMVLAMRPKRTDTLRWVTLAFTILTLILITRFTP